MPQTANGPRARPRHATGCGIFALWNEAWDPFFQLDSVWTDQFMAAGMGVYTGNVIEPKLAELLSIAFDVSYTHMYAPGTRRHIRAALRLGASLEEVMKVLKLCVVQGVQACNLGVLILAEELALSASAHSAARRD
jgi:alkylhydroperoxidase/carboxymuconolactone decarboxylase family protein YurZ